ncbi:MAG TPA: hypothetical protein VGZ22_08545, partial [Isosphaeraceae bacterium]|nr:hypothetical protein [Isosphaeraceae bacterium]
MKKQIVIPMLALAAAGLVLSVLFLNVGRGQGDDNELAVEAQRGLAIAPLPLNMHGKSRALVGLGSFIVNAVADCNGCHSTSEFLPGGDPFKGQPERINLDAYL